MIDKETILRLARENGAVFDVLAMGRHDGVLFTAFELERFAAALLAHRAESGVEVPEPIAHIYPSDVEKFRTSETFATVFSVAVGCPDERSVPMVLASESLDYGNARAAEALERAAEVCATEICDCCWDDDAKAAAEHLAEQIRSLTP